MHHRTCSHYGGTNDFLANCSCARISFTTFTVTCFICFDLRFSVGFFVIHSRDFIQQTWLCWRGYTPAFHSNTGQLIQRNETNAFYIVRFLLYCVLPFGVIKNNNNHYYLIRTHVKLTNAFARAMRPTYPVEWMSVYLEFSIIDGFGKLMIFIAQCWLINIAKR